MFSDMGFIFLMRRPYCAILEDKLTSNSYYFRTAEQQLRTRVINNFDDCQNNFDYCHSYYTCGTVAARRT